MSPLDAETQFRGDETAKQQVQRQSTLAFLQQMGEGRESVTKRTRSRMENEYDYCIGLALLFLCNDMHVNVT